MEGAGEPALAGQYDKAPPQPQLLQGRRFARWAWVELNYRPHAYQACALTT
jgi:hypothetical protein